MFGIVKDVLAVIGAWFIVSMIVLAVWAQVRSLVSATHERPGFIDVRH